MQYQVNKSDTVLRPVLRSYEQYWPIRGQCNLYWPIWGMPKHLWPIRGQCLPVHGAEEAFTPAAEASEAKLLLTNKTPILLLLPVLLLLLLLLLFWTYSCTTVCCWGNRLLYCLHFYSCSSFRQFTRLLLQSGNNISVMWPLINKRPVLTNQRPVFTSLSFVFSVLSSRLRLASAASAAASAWCPLLSSLFSSAASLR